jgi:hypothetical protein
VASAIGCGSSTDDVTPTSRVPVRGMSGGDTSCGGRTVPGRPVRGVPNWVGRMAPGLLALGAATLAAPLGLIPQGGLLKRQSVGAYGGTSRGSSTRPRVAATRAGNPLSLVDTAAIRATGNRVGGSVYNTIALWAVGVRVAHLVLLLPNPRRNRTGSGGRYIVECHIPGVGRSVYRAVLVRLRGPSTVPSRPST